MKKTNIHKLVFAAVLVALAVVGSLISFPIGASKCAPVQHLAFPGSMVGAFVAGMLYKYIKKLPAAYVGELFGTSVLGGLLAYPVARFLVGAPAAAITVYILPFFVSCAGGTVLAIVIVTALKKAKVFDNFLGFSKEVRA